MWNDTDLPLAYLITFRCRGTWLHGDERGSTDRFHNVYKSPHIPPNEIWKQHNQLSLKSEALTLDAYQRASVDYAAGTRVYIVAGHCTRSMCAQTTCTSWSRSEKLNLR